MRTDGSQVQAILVAALLGAASWAGFARAEPLPLSVSSVRNAELRVVFAASGKAKLVDGAYTEPAAPGAPVKLRVRLDEQVALGDLDGDGAGDAAVVLVSERAGGKVSFDLAAIVNRGGAPVHAATVHLGERVTVSSLVIEARRIRITFLVRPRGTASPEARPSEVREEYVLQGDRLTAPPVTPP